ncbi:hypothetical protein [Methylovirgula sp. 4M-Z18]|uniref:hypothetical protein n=1 Tax=Methylovirgula sp. 4M-Z18 TaxID=2293567 RepID=UPI0011C05F77|nr:hypothetical protein [Methylovirgula sp. 4M-Z18]
MDAPLDLDAWFASQQSPATPFSGQLDPAFQAALAAHFATVTEAQCVFYHTVELPGGRTISGEWDFREYEDTYLGGFAFTGKRVIEYGPATGWISAHIAARAQMLTVFDLPIGVGHDPVPDLMSEPPEAFARSAATHTDRQRNSWWLVRNAFGFQANAVYGDIFDPPADLGRYDVAMFGCILLHLMHPYRALQRAAEITDEAIIVADLALAPRVGEFDANRSSLLFSPSPPPNGVVHWWYLTPLAVSNMLTSLGFPQITVTTHRPPRMPNAPLLYTVVARRA